MSGRTHAGEPDQRRAEPAGRPGPGRRPRGSWAPSRRARRAGRRRSRARRRTRSGASRLSLTPSACSGSSMRCAIAGSATTPRLVEHTVMPSWAHASMSETCSIAHSTVRARRSPGARRAARSALRRAEMMANSAPTKNALRGQQQDAEERGRGSALMRSSSSSSALDRAHAATRSTRRPGHRVDPQPDAVDDDLVADVGDAAERGHEQPAERLVRAVVGDLQAGDLRRARRAAARRAAARSRRPAGRSPARRRSCSSATSPTSSSTTSSSVTTPEVPPYSSTTTAICRPELAQLDQQRAEVHGLRARAAPRP